MPTPGSHSYDLKRSRLRTRLENEGVPDDRADAQAAQILHREAIGSNPAVQSDRAAGPYGESGGEGDPGAVIDLRSPAFSESTLLPRRCTRDGKDLSPPLEWSSVPEATAELVLFCEDRDTPTRFLHWVVSGIPPETSGIREGQEVSGSTSWPNGFGEKSYGGPQPPVGDEPHRYFFRLFALEEPLTLAPGATGDDVRRAVAGTDHLAAGTLVGLYAR